MRAFLLVILLSAALGPVASTAQSVAINADSSLPDPSAILHLKSSSKGFLAPRMTQAQRNAIAAPATGLLIYQTDNTPGFYYYDSTSWTPAKSPGSPGGGLDSFWSAKGNDVFNTNSGNIGIGTDSIIAKLTVKTADSSWGIVHTDGTIDLSTFIGRGAAYFGTRSNHSLKLFVNGYPPGITISPNRGVGVNTDSPRNFFQIGEFQTGDRYTGADFLVTSLGVWTTLDNFPDASKITSNNDIQLHPKKSHGYVGINTTDTLSNYLQIGSVGHTGLVGNHFAMGNGNAAAAMNQYNSLLQVISTTDIALLPQVNHKGRVGINTTAPTNALQIGDMGTAGFNGNDIAFGNGAQATGIAQTSGFLQIGSNTDMALLPQYGTGAGRVGINTTTPRAPLEIAGAATVDPIGTLYFSYNYEGGEAIGDVVNPANFPNVSLLAGGNIFAYGFDAYSDVRIKDTLGRSSAANDLQTLRAIRITDYTMKDRATFGNKPFKKVIAQQVEQLYPQIVSKHADFIPNVYQLTDNVTKTADGYLLHFKRPHHLSDTAKKLQAIVAHHSDMAAYPIVSIPSANEVVIAAPAIPAEKVFVYGEEVNDFRTVDYEGLTTLNVSATQELDSEVQELKRDLTAARADMKLMIREINRLKNNRKKTIN
jgi:hypothetical protein